MSTDNKSFDKKVLRVAECLIEPHHPDDPMKEAEYIVKALERLESPSIAASTNVEECSQYQLEIACDTLTKIMSGLTTDINRIEFETKKLAQETLEEMRHVALRAAPSLNLMTDPHSTKPAECQHDVYLNDRGLYYCRNCKARMAISEYGSGLTESLNTKSAKEWTSIEIFQRVNSGDDIGLPETFVSLSNHSQLERENTELTAEKASLQTTQGAFIIELEAHLFKIASLECENAELKSLFKEYLTLEGAEDINDWHDRVVKLVGESK